MHFSTVLAPVLLAFSATASPIDSVDQSLVARSIPKTFAAHAAAAIKLFGPGAAKTMMHSGIGPGLASKIATGKGLKTVETTIMQAVMADKSAKGGKNLYKDTLQKYCIPKKDYCDLKGGNEADWVEAWGTISAAWANYAQTQTTLATSKEGPDPKSFYKTYEEPVLTHNHVQVTVDDTHPKANYND